MKTFASAFASAVLLTVVSGNFAAAELALDSRGDIQPVATQSTTASTSGQAGETAQKPGEARYQTAAADAQASVPPPKPVKKAAAKPKPRPRYVEEPVLVVRHSFRPVFRPAFRPVFRLGGRW